MECYNLASILQPGLGAAWLRLGGACRDAGMYGQAVRAFSRAMELTGGRGDDGVEALSGLVYCKQVQGYIVDTSTQYSAPEYHNIHLSHYMKIILMFSHG